MRKIIEAVGYIKGLNPAVQKLKMVLNNPRQVTALVNLAKLEVKVKLSFFTTVGLAIVCFILLILTVIWPTNWLIGLTILVNGFLGLRIYNYYKMLKEAKEKTLYVYGFIKDKGNDVINVFNTYFTRNKETLNT